MKKFTLSIILMFALTAPCWASTSKGWEALKKKDYATAQRVLMAAAMDGKAHAKYGIGMMLIRGMGVKIDLDEGMRWLRESAGQGDGDARMALGRLHGEDHPLLKDYVKSYVWLTLALAKVRAGKRDDTVAMRITLIRRMTPEQIERAEKMAQQWRELDNKD